MDGIKTILSRIKDFCNTHAVDFENDLLAYDNKRLGIMSQVSVYRWFGSIGMNLSNRNIQQIILAFKKDEGVDVHRFIEGIRDSSSFNKTISEHPPNCVNELLELARETSRRSQTIRDILKVFDRLNLGHVSPENFYRAFGATPAMRTIANCYTIGDEIDYLRLSNDVYKVSKSHTVSPQPAIPQPTQAFGKLAKYIKDRDADLTQFNGHSDRFTYQQFMSALSSLGAPLSPSELQEIANSFLDRTSGFYNYDLFIKAVDDFIPPRTQTFNQTNLAAPEEARPSPVSPTALLEAAKGTIARRRIEVAHYFSNVPREGFGDEIPITKFLSIVNGMKIDLNPQEIRSIATLFKGNQGVRYNDFVDAVTPPSTTITIQATDVVEKLRNYLYENRKTIARVALRYDRENTGEIATNQLNSILRFVGFDFTNQELAALRDAFQGSQHNTISWRNLSAQVDQPIKPYDSQLLASNQENQSFGHSQFSRTKVSSNPPPGHLVTIIKKILAAQCQRESPTPSGLIEDLRHEITPSDTSFLDVLVQSDELNRGAVNQQVFVNFIYSLQANLTTFEIRTLSSYYRVTGSSDVNYLQFTQDVESVNKQIVEEEEKKLRETPVDLQTTGPLGTQNLERELPPEMHQFLQRFKSFATQNRFEPSDLFAPYDNLHNGTVHTSRVQACLAQVDFPIKKQDLDLIIKCFEDPQRPFTFNYAAFNHAFQDEDINSSEVRQNLTAAPISAEIDRAACLACLQIREKLLARHRIIDVYFRDVTTPTISTREFQKRLNSLDFVIHASETMALIRKYRANLSDNIDYKKFCQDVNNSKTL